VYIYVLGDITDAEDIYKSQVTLLRGGWQVDGAAYILARFARALHAARAVRRIFLMPGNHDARVADYFNRAEIIAVRLGEYLERLWNEKNYLPEVIVIKARHVLDIGGKRIGLYHTVARRSRGSYAGA